MPFSDAGRVIRVGIVADDLTGSGDTGVQFAKRGWATYVFSPVVYPSESEMRRLRGLFAATPVLAVNTQSRHLAPREAGRRARLAFSLVRDRKLIYKKVDSSLRGNIGAELDAGLRATGGEAALFCAAYPAQGRITLDGVHYINKEELSCTEAGTDPKAPVGDSRVCRIIARQSGLRVTPLENLRFTGDDARLAELVEERFRSGWQILACDAQSDRDLEALARVALGSARPLLLAGSAGFATQLAGLLPERAERVPAAASARRHHGPVLVASGSASARNAAQLRRLVDRPAVHWVAITPEQLLRRLGPARQERSSIRRVLGSLLEGDEVVVLAIKPDAASGSWPAEKLSPAFGAFLARLLRRQGGKVRGLVATGGETAELLLRNLGARGIRLAGEVEAGVPFGLVDGGILEGLPVITKAGALGTEDTLANCAEFLAGVLQEERTG